MKLSKNVILKKKKYFLIFSNLKLKLKNSVHMRLSKKKSLCCFINYSWSGKIKSLCGQCLLKKLKQSVKTAVHHAYAIVTIKAAMLGFKM